MSWYYLDDSQNEVGPYTAVDIRDWYASGQLPPDIFIKNGGDWIT